MVNKEKQLKEFFFPAIVLPLKEQRTKDETKGFFGVWCIVTCAALNGSMSNEASLFLSFTLFFHSFILSLRIGKPFFQ